ncbi:MAG TPA: isoprenylcysteine carboxylmethyltransferase family protein [Alphaproteobacteria bacterium]|nr:isoprenylcysteine carboxylmethyltransferase family protein [Alphaproteobacteria bacterium]
MATTDAAWGRDHWRALGSLVVSLVLMAGLLFLPAGTLDWPLGWGFLAAFIVGVMIGVVVLWRLNPEIFAARSRVQPGTEAWDYLILILVIGGFIAILTVAGLDFRFGWSAVPAWAVWLGYLLFTLAFAGQIWAQAVNRHFEPGVRVQQDRQQTVIDTGPYAIVRHPGYISGSLLALSLPLLLGSWWALAPALVVVAALAIRTPLEERTLRAGLPGYAEYAERVRWRWIPGLW